MIVNRVFIKKLPIPYSDCRGGLDQLNGFDSELFRAILLKNKSYTQNRCFDLCSQRETIKMCNNCYLNSYEKLNGQKPCQTDNELRCATEAHDYYVKNINKLCMQDCPLECDTIEYQIATTYSHYPSMNYAKEELMNRPLIKSKLTNDSKLNYELIRQSVLSLNVYYDDFLYAEYSQSPKGEIPDLVSNVGGIVGVFIGASLLSFVEIFEVLIVMFNNLKHNMNKNRISQLQIDH